jgi:hypothetical protein
MPDELPNLPPGSVPSRKPLAEEAHKRPLLLPIVAVVEGFSPPSPYLLRADTGAGIITLK